MKGARNILIVEDNPDDAYFMLRALQQLDPELEVEVCPDAAGALKRLFDSDRPLPRVVFLDLNLGRESGHQALREIRNHSRTRGLPVVIVSGSQIPEDVVRSYAIGANSHVRKPLFATELADTVRRVADYWARMNSVPTGDDSLNSATTTA